MFKHRPRSIKPRESGFRCFNLFFLLNSPKFLSSDSSCLACLLLTEKDHIKNTHTQVQGKLSNFTVNRDHTYKKVRKQGWLPTDADILVGI